MSRLNPPILENTLPAFAKSNVESCMVIPFQLNRSVSKIDFEKIQVLIKSVQSNVILYHDSIIINDGDLNGRKGQLSLIFGKDDFPVAGQYYKIQIAFVDKNNDIGFYSNVGIIKCITLPLVEISGRNENSRNTHEYVGTYTGDITEKVYSYQFNLYDDAGNLLETSGVLIHDSSEDEESNSSKDVWTITRALEPNRTYEIGYQITTVNGYSSGEIRYPIIEVETINPNLHADLSVKCNFENGYNNISLVGDGTNILLNGSFILLRASSEDDYSSWNEICKFKLFQWHSSGTKQICKDYCIRQGHCYKYALQAYNNNGLYSNKVENKEGPVLCDFEDCFLYDGEKQLKIRFNPKVSSFKSTVLESKMDTLGGKYPFIFRNGVVEYKEFSISGLLSLLSDDNGDFFNAFSYGDQTTRISTPTDRNDIPLPYGTLLTAENYRSEREYKMQALAWLTNGKPKLFRSPAEGNFIVRLMNTSLSPNDTLGRLLHTFTSTAYEIAEYNYLNLKEYGFTVDDEVETREMSFQQINLLSPDSSIKTDSDGYLVLPKMAYLASVVADRNVIFQYKLFDGNKIYEGSTNLTGVFVFPEEVLKETPLTAIKLKSSSWGTEAHITYGYYCEPNTSFSYIKTINVTDKIIQQSGLGLNKNIIDEYTDIRKQVGDIHYLKVQKKIIETISYNASKQRYEFDSVTPVSIWNRNCLYDCGDFYIDGETPPNKDSGGKYTNPENDILLIKINKTTPDLFGFILNDSDTVDFKGTSFEGQEETHGRYQALTNLKNVYKIAAGKGIIMDIVYQEKEIIYMLEDTNSIVKGLKSEWIVAENAYKNSLTDGSSALTQKTLKNQSNSKYDYYILNLERELEKEMGEVTYAI